MATFDLGRVTPLYKGDYSATESYELNDVVLYDGNLYWHVQAAPTTGILPTDATVWKLAFADEGIREEIRGYADDAQESADNASTSAQTAQTKASEAAASAESAREYDESAQQSAVNAQTSATNAATSEANARTYAESASAYLMTDEEAADLLATAEGEANE